MSAAIPHWWPGSVGYEIYVRSFADSSDDGFGDLEGVRSRLDYLQWLGIDLIWLTPFYPSPDVDHGYDVSDYRDVDPRFGDLTGFGELVADAHRRGMRVMIDIVPNHSSSHHPFFQQALTDPTGPYRDWYVWRDPGPDGGPPNNWTSHFGGPAWTRDPGSGQYYCHLFHRDQPDFNWRNPEVARYFHETLAFWCDRGVDGFRVDVSQGLLKDPALRDNPLRPGATGTAFSDFAHIHDLDQEQTPEVFRGWAQAVAPYDACLMGEVWAANPLRIARYTTAGGLHTAFYLEPCGIDWEPGRLVAMVRAMHAVAPQQMAWVLDNHDKPRSATRYGGGTAGKSRSLALMTVLFALGGAPFLYQGQELGLEDGEVAPEDRQDPISRYDPDALGRDGTRTVMPWSAAAGNGFSTVPAWLRSRDRSAGDTVAAQMEDPGSPLHRHRELIATRRRLPDLWRAPAVWHEAASPDQAVLQRGSVVVAANLGDTPGHMRLPPGHWNVAFVSSPLDLVPGPHRDRLALPPATSVILVTG